MNKRLFSIPTLHIQVPRKKYVSWGLVFLVILFCWDSLFDILRSWQIFTFISITLYISSSCDLRRNLFTLSREQRKLLKFAKYALIVCFLFYIYLFLFTLSAGTITLHTITSIATKVMPYAYLPLFVVISMALITYHRSNIVEFWIIRVLALYLILSIIIRLGMGFSIAQNHNAFWGFLASILMCYYIRILTFNKNVNIIRKILYIFMSVALFSFPFLTSLRGASGIALITLTIMIFVSLKSRKRNVLIIIFLVPLIVFTLGSKSIYSSSFDETSRYGYTNPVQVLSQGYSLSDRNAVGRFEWWKAAFGVFKENPITGTGFSYTFKVFDRNKGSGSLHNYYASMLVDGGLLLFIPSLSMVIYGFYVGIRKFLRGDASKSIYIAWIIAATLTYFTNCYGHVPFSSGVLALIQGYSLSKLVAN